MTTVKIGAGPHLPALSPPVTFFAQLRIIFSLSLSLP
jgi:hypothetical protein